MNKFYVFKHLREWVRATLFTPTPIPAAPAALKKIIGPLGLKDVFICKLKYDKIMRLLIERGYISPVNHHWIDKKGGKKSFICCLIKTLEEKGYFDYMFWLTGEKIIELSWNTFRIDIGIDLIKHNHIYDHDCSFIPMACDI